MNAGRKRPAEAYPQHPPQAVPRTRKKPTDKTLPKMMEEHQPEESKLYNQLREAEARIDATILRKRFDLLDALNRPLKVSSLPWVLSLMNSVRRNSGCRLARLHPINPGNLLLLSILLHMISILI